MADSARAILASGAEKLGISLSAAQLDLLDAFTALVLEWNTKLNLTRITDPVEIAVKHYLDSISLLAFVQALNGARVIDVGTGAGFPGIPLKIVRPDLKMTLLDSVGKKLTFLQASVEQLGLADVELVHGRAEDWGRVQSYRERFDVGLSRAVARMSVLAEFCLPFCRIGGVFVAYKGPDAEAEVKEASEAIRVLGGELRAVHAFDLPESDQRRTLVVIGKTATTPSRYPRKAGVPERNPL